MLLPLLLAPMPATAAPIVQTSRSCYYDDGRGAVLVRVLGVGFTPAAPFSVSLDGEDLDGGAGMIAQDGTMTGTFSPPRLRDGEYERRFSIGLATAEASPQTDFTVSRLYVGFSNAVGPVDTLKVRYSIYGFNLDGPARRVYLHYVSPTYRHVKTIALGRPRGQCGSIRRSDRHRLFPFERVRRGRWRLQFDTNRTYRSPNEAKFLYYSVRVKVGSSGANTSSWRSPATSTASAATVGLPRGAAPR